MPEETDNGLRKRITELKRRLYEPLFAHITWEDGVFAVLGVYTTWEEAGRAEQHWKEETFREAARQSCDDPGDQPGIEAIEEAYEAGCLDSIVLDFRRPPTIVEAVGPLGPITLALQGLVSDLGAGVPHHPPVIDLASGSNCARWGNGYWVYRDPDGDEHYGQEASAAPLASSE